MASPYKLNQSYEGNNHKKKHHSQKQMKSKSHGRVSLTSNPHNSSSLPPRTIGGDGHYCQCVVCDIGGKLLCCDTCPNTYHLQCLSPPLYSVPAGDWQCQICSEVAPSIGFWLDQELDSLWVGVRKFGQGKWEDMLKDPSLYFSEFKTVEDLARKWKMERRKIIKSEETLDNKVVSIEVRLNSMPSSGDQLPVTIEEEDDL